MKKNLTLMGLLATFCTLLASGAFAADPVFTCTGQAENNSIKIEKLVISRKTVTLDYSTEGKTFSKNYQTVEFLERNGSVGNVKTFLVGANQSGEKNDYKDDMSLPHLGLFPTSQKTSALSSDIAFDHNSNRVFGTVTCIEE